jgi:hypothetical protein
MKINIKKNAFETSSISLSVTDSDRNFMYSIFEELSIKTGMHFVPLSSIKFPQLPPGKVIKFVEANNLQAQIAS